jgi:Zn-dependent oligopeptidase
MQMILTTFDLSPTQIRNSILDILELNRTDFKRLIINQKDNPEINAMLVVLETLDMRLGQVCAPVQNLLNVKPSQEITQHEWFQEFIAFALKQKLNAAQFCILKQYEKMFVLAGVRLNIIQKTEYAFFLHRHIQEAIHD